MTKRFKLDKLIRDKCPNSLRAEGISVEERQVEKKNLSSY